MDKKARILCCGEALIDMIPVETMEGGIAYSPCSGGSVFNTAISLGRLGIGTEFLTGLSSDLFGDQIRETLAQSGVRSSLCRQSPLPTTLAFVKLVDGHATYHFYDENSAGRMLALEDVGPVPPSIEALYFGGISLCVEPSARTYEAVLVRESSDHLIMMDPNIRPGFIQDETSYRARLGNMMAHSDIVKVSDEDLDWFMVDQRGADEQARAMLDLGPSLVIVTRGAEGANAYLADGHQVFIPAPITKVIDTVGAGDTFNAGFLARLADLDLLSKEAIRTISASALEEAMGLAAQVAAVTVSRKGANPPWRDEL